MKTMRVFWIFPALLVLISSWADPTKAALNWEFGFVGEVDGFSGSGSFTLAGPNTSDGLDAFEYNGNCAGNLCSFDLSDVDIPGSLWKLEDDWTFESITLSATKDLSNPFLQMQVTITSFTVVCFDATIPDDACNGTDQAIGQATYASNGAFLRPIHEAPEPSTLALFAIALGGLGFMMRRRVA